MMVGIPVLVSLSTAWSTRKQSQRSLYWATVGFTLACLLLLLVVRLGQDAVVGTSIAVFGLPYLVIKSLDIWHEIRRDQETVTVSRIFSYLIFLPTYWVGPIMRFRDWKVVPKWRGLAELDEKDWLRLGWGLIKVFGISRWLFQYSPLGNDLGSFSMIKAYALTLYVYFEFSGLCDVAIVGGKLFGVSVPENFNKPFLATDLQDFWNRWHITLSLWFRDRLYFPLMKSLCVRGVQVEWAYMIGITATFCSMALWHGVNWNWLLYGVLHGTGIIASRYLSERKAVLMDRIPSPALDWVLTRAAQLVTFHFVVLAFYIAYLGPGALIQ